ncbi:MAG: DNA recombination protein RmuC [Negativicutes bacterium]|nr:DNA recombination protein RmuC [Negativicutes bacterium]
MNDSLLFTALAGFTLINLIVLVAVYSMLKRNLTRERELEKQFRDVLQNELLQEERQTRQEIQQTMQNVFSTFSQWVRDGQSQNTQMLDTRLSELNKQYSQRNEEMQRQISQLTLQTQNQLAEMNRNVNENLTAMKTENGRQLDLMRQTVDEKLQKTLEERIGQSFQLVSQRLEEVYKGLGEMQTLAVGVGDLKKVLTNVKTRGMLGELQLGAILEQLLSPEQYATNVAVVPNTAERVEFAIKLPGDGSGTVWLPIDSKFPVETYQALLAAYDSGQAELVAQSGKEFERIIKTFAKTIHDKYIRLPFTTNFAIMFLPVEGLYAEVVRHGMIETLQREYQINIAGPTTMAALLNSLQMGFRTLAIQKQSGEVWRTLGGVKAEFEKFAGVLGSTQKKLDQARDELDKLVGVRTRAIRSKLREIEALPEAASGPEPELAVSAESEAENPPLGGG